MIGPELRRARLAAKLTQEELSLRTGIDRVFISNIERGRAQPTVAKFVQLARAVGLKGSTLLARAERAEARREGDSPH